VDAQSGGCLDIPLAVVDEECLLRTGLLPLQHQAEDTLVGLHHSTLIAQIEAVEVAVYRMAQPVELGASGPLHHIGIGIRQQAQLIALLAERLQHVEIAAGYASHVSVPRFVAFAAAELAACQLVQGYAELFGSDAAFFQLAEDALLLVCVQMLACIAQADALELSDGSFVVECQYYASQVEGYVLYLLHAVMLYSVCKVTKSL